MTEQQNNTPPGFDPQLQQQAAQPQMQVQQDHQALPELFIPDDELIAAATAQAQADLERAEKARNGQSGSSGWKFFQPLGPQGQTSWGEDVPTGYEATYRAWICTSPREGEMPYIEERTHFWKSPSAPRGTSIAESDIILAARKVLFSSADDKQIEHAKNNGKPQSKHIYQILLVDYPDAHFNEEGKMVPYVFRASFKAHQDIVGLFKKFGAARIVDPMQGRPVLITKKKIGKEITRVEWSVTADLDASPLNPVFYAALHNLQDTRTLLKKNTAADIHKALTEMRLPITQEIGAMLQSLQAQEAQAAQQVQAAQPQPASYQQQAAPPTANPHLQQQYAQPQAQTAPPLTNLHDAIKG